MNRWGIPPHVEQKVLLRDKKCVYCGVAFKKYIRSTRRRIAIATWEHIDNDVENRTTANVARCCSACNSSLAEFAFRVEALDFSPGSIAYFAMRKKPRKNKIPQIFSPCRGAASRASSAVMKSCPHCRSF